MSWLMTVGAAAVGFFFLGAVYLGLFNDDEGSAGVAVIVTGLLGTALVGFVTDGSLLFTTLWFFTHVGAFFGVQRRVGV